MVAKHLGLFSYAGHDSASWGGAEANEEYFIFCLQHPHPGSPFYFQIGGHSGPCRRHRMYAGFIPLVHFGGQRVVRWVRVKLQQNENPDHIKIQNAIWKKKARMHIKHVRKCLMLRSLFYSQV